MASGSSSQPSVELKYPKRVEKLIEKARKASRSSVFLDTSKYQEFSVGYSPQALAAWHQLQDGLSSGTGYVVKPRMSNGVITSGTWVGTPDDAVGLMFGGSKTEKDPAPESSRKQSASRPLNAALQKLQRHVKTKPLLDPHFIIYKSCPVKHKDSLRLLSLQPSKSASEPLCAHFIPARLSESPSYEAISYTWGEPIFQEELHLDSGTLMITKNLKAALRRFRLDDEPRMLWADAICINQLDDEEKSHQVAMMAQIYKKTKRALIWLGEGTEETDRAMEFIGDRLLSIASKYTTDPLYESAWFKSPVIPPSKPLSPFLDIPEMALGYDIDSVYSRPWFNRVWIVQEVVLAPRSTLFCGGKEMEWSDFELAMTLLQAVTVGDRDRTYRNMGAFFSAYMIVQTRGRYHTLHPSEPASRYQQIGEVVYKLREQECQDDHDRIFALLSFLPSDATWSITPDYKKSVFQTFTQFAEAYLRKSQIDILYDAGLWDKREAAGQDEGYLPSWVPDFRNPNPFPKECNPTIFDPIARRGLHWLKQRSFKCRTALKPEVLLIPEVPESIFLRGILLDRVIKRVSIYIHNTKYYSPVEPYDMRYAFRLVRKAVLKCKDLFTKSLDPEGYITGQHQYLVFARTIVADNRSLDLEGLSQDGEELSVNLIANGWLLYEKHCLQENGEVYMKDCKTPHEFTEMLINDGAENPFSEEAQLAVIFYKCVNKTLEGHSFFITEKGLIGIGPHGVEPGDVLALVDGAHTPFIVKMTRGAVIFRIFGPCYVHGVMEGESVIGDPNQTILFGVI